MNTDSVDNYKYFHNCFTGRLIDTIGGVARRIVKNNNLGQVSLVHVSPGKYHLKSDGLFKTGLTHFSMSNDADGHPEYSIVDESTIEINILTEREGQPINNRLYAAFQIIVYHSEETRAAYHKTFG